MEAVKTIKGVDEETWQEFKSLAAKRKKNMGKFLGELVESYKGNTDAFWEKVFSYGKTLTDKEADEMEKTIAKLRKEKGFRI
jgi:hypothetical protein